MKNDEHCLERGEQCAGRYGGLACAENLGCADEVLSAWVITDCNTNEPVVQSSGNKVSSTISAIKKNSCHCNNKNAS